MSYTIVNRPSVKVDILESIKYYKTILPQLARQFLFRLRESRAYLAKSPLSFQVKYKNIRTLLLRQFPYHIHYIVIEDSKQIVVLAIVHAYKKPQELTL